MGEITNNINAELDLDSSEVRSACPFNGCGNVSPNLPFDPDTYAPAPFINSTNTAPEAPIQIQNKNVPTDGYFNDATQLSPNSAKYDTYRTQAKGYGTSYFLKIPSSVSYDGTWELLKEEYQINKKLIDGNCPHIVRYYELAECSDGRPYIRAEYIHGETLADYLAFDAKNMKKSDEFIADYFRKPSNTRRFIRQFLECLQRMHELSVVHHDLKPGNLLIDCIAGNLYVFDFDLSVGPSSTDKSYGWTVGYEDPEAKEMLRNGNADWYDIFGPQFDIYSFGIIIHNIFKSYNLNMTLGYKRILDKCICSRKDRYQNVDDILYDFNICWSAEAHNIENYIKNTKTFNAAIEGDIKAKNLIKEFIEYENKID